MAYVHHVGDFLVEPFILLENSVHGKQNALEKHVACDENLVHIKSSFENVSDLYFRITFFQFSIKYNKDWNTKQRQNIYWFCRI